MRHERHVKSRLRVFCHRLPDAQQKADRLVRQSQDKKFSQAFGFSNGRHLLQVFKRKTVSAFNAFAVPCGTNINLPRYKHK